jgi:hypothetical protein
MTIQYTIGERYNTDWTIIVHTRICRSSIVGYRLTIEKMFVLLTQVNEEARSRNNEETNNYFYR